MERRELFIPTRRTLTTLFKGYHSAKLIRQIKHAWAQDELLVICSPLVRDSSFEDFLPGGKSAPVYPEKPILGIFTTGTVSGNPRLVLYSKANVEASLRSIYSLFDEQRIEEVFCYPQPFHTFGLVLGYLYAMLKNKKLHFLEGHYSKQAHELRASIRTPHLLTLGTPTHFHDLLNEVREKRIALAPSYTSILGGAKVSPELWRSIQMELQIESPSIGYGATEACPGVTHLPPGSVPTEDGEIGFPLPEVHVSIRDGEGLEFSGANTCLAYVENGEVVFPKSVILTDVIEKRTDGRMIYVGRISQTLNRGGSKYSFEKLESLITAELGLRTLALPIKHSRLGEDLALILEMPKPQNDHSSLDQELLREQIQALLKREFGHHFALEQIQLAQHLPTNENGKLDRAKALSEFQQPAFPVSST